MINVFTIEEKNRKKTWLSIVFLFFLLDLVVNCCPDIDGLPRHIAASEEYHVDESVSDPFVGSVLIE